MRINPHTAPDTETGANPMDRMFKAELFLDIAIEKLDTFAKSFGLPNGWWFPNGSS
jgi:hypothetical protein